MVKYYTLEYKQITIYSKFCGGAKVQVTGQVTGHRPQVRSQVSSQVTGQVTGHTLKPIGHWTKAVLD